jgi:hypothetical protein
MVTSCEREGRTELTVFPGRAEVVPYDFTTSSTLPCLSMLRTFAHEATLRFDVRGEWTVTVRGREEPGSHVREFLRQVRVR